MLSNDRQTSSRQTSQLATTICLRNQVTPQGRRQGCARPKPSPRLVDTVLCACEDTMFGRMIVRVAVFFISKLKKSIDASPLSTMLAETLSSVGRRSQPNKSSDDRQFRHGCQRHCLRLATTVCQRNHVKLGFVDKLSRDTVLSWSQLCTEGINYAPWSTTRLSESKTQ